MQFNSRKFQGLADAINNSKQTELRKQLAEEFGLCGYVANKTKDGRSILHVYDAQPDTLEVIPDEKGYPQLKLSNSAWTRHYIVTVKYSEQLLKVLQNIAQVLMTGEHFHLKSDYLYEIRCYISIVRGYELKYSHMEPAIRRDYNF